MADAVLDEEAPVVALSTVGWFVGLVILVAGIVHDRTCRRRRGRRAALGT